MALFAYKEYKVRQEHIDGGEGGRNLQVNVPVKFLRESCTAGDLIIINFDDDQRDRLVITVSKAIGNGAQAGGEGQ